MTSQQSIKLGEIAEIFSGFAFKSEDLKEGNIPVIRIANIQNKEVLKSCNAFFPSSKLSQKLNRYFLQADDVLVAMTGAGSVGKVGKMIEKDRKYLVNQRVGIVRVNKSKADPEYVYQVLSQDFYEQRLYQLGLGAGQPNVSANDIGNLEIPCPSIKIQKKLGKILSDYSILSDKNRKRVQLLEQMAKLVYDEWFVKFKFPGHESVKMVDSELGEIPEGWKVKKLGDVIPNIVLGGTPSRTLQEYWGGNIPWIKSGQLNDLRVLNGTEFITEEGFKNSATRLMPKRTVLIAITGAILISLSEIELCANQSVIGIYGSKILSQEYLYLYHKFNIEKFISKMSGSAQQHINKEIVSGSPILVPPANLIDGFTLHIKPIFDEIVNLLFKNKNLSATRDLLLPRLISGEVDVSELDIKVPEVEA